MSKKERYTIYAVFSLVFIAFAIYNLMKGSQWFFDSTISFVLLTVLFFINRWVDLERLEFILFGIGFLVHDLGTFGFYNWKYGAFAYDNFMHIFAGIIIAYIIFNMTARKLHMWKHHKVKRTVVDEHKILLIFLVVSAVILLGTVVEVTEFAGFMLLGSGEGLLFAGAGDGYSYGEIDIRMQYIDTMEDLIMNIIGAFIGVLLFYYSRYSKRPWLRR